MKDIQSLYSTSIYQEVCELVFLKGDSRLSKHGKFYSQSAFYPRSAVCCLQSANVIHRATGACVLHFSNVRSFNTRETLLTIKRAFSMFYLSNRPQVSMVYRLINHAGCW